MESREIISSEDLSIGKLLRDFYEVPVYQREYVWQQRQVEQLLEDILDRFANGGESSEYFIGSIVTSQNEQTGVFELIDGQQRVTTLFIIMCAIRDTLIDLGADVPNELRDQIRDTKFDKSTYRDKERFRVVLNYQGGQGVLEEIGTENLPATRAKKSARTASAQNLMDAYDEAMAFLRDRFDQDANKIKDYWWYLSHNVKLIRVKTGSLTDALIVFETINDRGIGLDPMDLLKNLLFINAEDDQYEALRGKWETLSSLLYKREKPLRFLRYFVMSSYDSGLIRSDEAYKWLKENAESKAPELLRDPVAFADKLIEVAECMGNLLEGKNPDGLGNRYLQNLACFAGSARQHLILLLAGKHLPKDAFERLTKEVEDLFFIFIVTSTPKNEFEKRFAGWAPIIRQLKDLNDLDAFIDREILPVKHSKAKEFEFALSNLADLSLPKYRKKYLLAKLAQHVNELAMPNTGWEDLGKLMGTGFEIEHILPENPSDQWLNSFDKSPELLQQYTHRLGNLVLLEKSINASVGNASYENVKRENYKKSSLLLTRVIAEPVTIGKQTSYNRILSKFSSFDRWDSAAIEQREKELISLAREVWGVRSDPDWPDIMVSI